MKVMIVEEVMTGDVSPVAMFIIITTVMMMIIIRLIVPTPQPWQVMTINSDFLNCDNDHKNSDGGNE